MPRLILILTLPGEGEDEVRVGTARNFEIGYGDEAIRFDCTPWAVCGPRPIIPEKRFTANAFAESARYTGDAAKLKIESLTK